MKNLLLAMLAIVCILCLNSAAHAQYTPPGGPGSWSDHYRISPSFYKYKYDATGSYFYRQEPTVTRWGNDVWGNTYQNVSGGNSWGHVNGQPFNIPGYGGWNNGGNPGYGGYNPGYGGGNPGGYYGGYNSGYVPPAPAFNPYGGYVNPAGGFHHSPPANRVICIPVP